MLSILLGILSGAFDASARIPVKLSRIPPLRMVWISTIITLPIWAAWLFVGGIPHVSFVFWIVLAVDVPLLLAAKLLTVHGHRNASMTGASVYMALTPAFMLITTPLFFSGARPTLWGVMGVIGVVVGVIIANAKQGLAPRALYAELRREHGTASFIGIAAIYAITANLDKLAIDTSNIPFYLTFYSLCVSVAAFVIDKVKNNTHPRVRGDLYALAAGLLSVFAVAPHMLALTYTHDVEYVIAAKRAGLVLFTIVGGIMLGLMVHKHKGELQDLGRKVVAAVTVFASILLIIFYGM